MGRVSINRHGVIATKLNTVRFETAGAACGAFAVEPPAGGIQNWLTFQSFKGGSTEAVWCWFCAAQTELSSSPRIRNFARAGTPLSGVITGFRGQVRRVVAADVAGERLSLLRPLDSSAAARPFERHADYDPLDIPMTVSIGSDGSLRLETTMTFSRSVRNSVMRDPPR